MGKQWKQWQTIFLGSKITADGDSNHLIKRHFPWKESYDKPRQHIKKQRHYFADKVPYSLRCSFSSSLVWMWELDNKETWTLKNWCFWALVLEMTLESPLDFKKFKPVNPKGNQSWIFITGIGAEAPVLWPPNAKGWLIRKDPDAGKDWRLSEKGMTEDEMVGWHHQFNGHESEQAPGDGEGQGSLACCRPWGSQIVRHDWATEQKPPIKWICLFPFELQWIF